MQNSNITIWKRPFSTMSTFTVDTVKAISVLLSTCNVESFILGYFLGWCGDSCEQECGLDYDKEKWEDTGCGD